MKNILNSILTCYFLVVTSSANAEGLRPVEVGLATYTWHASYSDKYSSHTVGPYALWALTDVGDYSVKAMGAALKLSTGATGTITGILVDKGPFSIALVGVHGYSTMPLVPTISIGLRFNLPDGYKTRITFQPSPTSYRGVSSSSTVTLWLGHSF